MDEGVRKERQATCIEVLVFVIWYCFVMVMVLGQYESDGYMVANTVRENILEKAYTSTPLMRFGEIRDPSSFQLWAQKVYIPWAIGERIGQTGCDVDEESVWGWDSACTNAPLFERAGPILIWQVGTNELPIVEASTGTTYPYTDIDSGYEFPGMFKSYKTRGYFRLWGTSINNTEAEEDLINMGCSAQCSCLATYDLSFDSCFGCSCETETQAVAAGQRSTFFNQYMTSALAFVTVFVNDGRVVVLTAMFETRQPGLGLGWTPSYMLFSLQKIELAYFIFVYLIMALFTAFSVKQIKDQGWAYLSSLWNLFDLVNLVLFLVGLVLAGIFMAKYDSFTRNSPEAIDASTMIEMMSAADWQQRSMALFGINQLIMNVKLIKYIQALDFIPGLAMPVAALQEAGIEMLAFMVTLVLICFGFAQTFTAWFGDRFQSYHDTSTSFTHMMLALAGYPNFKELGSQTLQTNLQKTGVALLSIYCYFFIFFFLVMLVAIQHVAYNKVRGQFLKEARRFLTLRQFCKLLSKKFKETRAVVGQSTDTEEMNTFQGSWWAWAKHEMRLYWLENFADLSEQRIASTEEDEDLGGGQVKLNKYELGRLDQVHSSMNHLRAMSEMHERLSTVLSGITQNVQQDLSDSEGSEEEDLVEHKKPNCCWKLFKKDEKEDDDMFEHGDTELVVNPVADKEDREGPEYQTGQELSMGAGACDRALSKMEELDKRLRRIVERQQQQQANILHNCDLVVSAYSSSRGRSKTEY